jgi:hypothetical protein
MFGRRRQWAALSQKHAELLATMCGIEDVRSITALRGGGGAATVHWVQEDDMSLEELAAHVDEEAKFVEDKEARWVAEGHPLSDCWRTEAFWIWEKQSYPDPSIWWEMARDEAMERTRQRNG